MEMFSKDRGVVRYVGMSMWLEFVTKHYRKPKTYVCLFFLSIHKFSGKSLIGIA